VQPNGEQAAARRDEIATPKISNAYPENNNAPQVATTYATEAAVPDV